MIRSAPLNKPGSSSGPGAIAVQRHEKARAAEFAHGGFARRGADAPTAPACACGDCVKSEEKAARTAFLGSEQHASRRGERQLSVLCDGAKDARAWQSKRLLGGPKRLRLRGGADEKEARESEAKLRKTRRIGRAVFARAGVRGDPDEKIVLSARRREPCEGEAKRAHPVGGGDGRDFRQRPCGGAAPDGLEGRWRVGSRRGGEGGRLQHEGRLEQKENINKQAGRRPAPRGKTTR